MPAASFLITGSAGFEEQPAANGAKANAIDKQQTNPSLLNMNDLPLIEVNSNFTIAGTTQLVPRCPGDSTVDVVDGPVAESHVRTSGVRHSAD